LAGFYGKYFIFLSLIETGHYGLATLAVAYVAVAAYYYLRIANAMLLRPATDTEPVPMTWGLGAALAVTSFATVFIGIYPEPFIRIANWSIGITQSAASMAQLIR
jgi:NADH:ubiquinone oxidoreductase subunit 2 (subunit N)